MSKFNELCDAFTKARIAFKDYEKECNAFAIELWNALLQYFEIPPAQADLYNFDALGEAHKVKSTQELTLALGEDAYFEFGIGITLFELPKVYPYPHHTILLPIHLAVDTDGSYKVKMGPDGHNFIVDRAQATAYQAFFDSLFDSLKREYERGLENMKMHNTFRKIGYGN